MPANPQWPAILTNASWQKEKGKVSKLAGKTGVGEAMNAAQADFLKINWNTIAAEDIAPKDRDMPIILERKKAAIAYINGPVDAARQKIKVIRDKAHATAENWKKNPLIPKSAREAAEKIEKAADLLFLSLKSNSQVIGEFLASFDKMYDVKKGQMEKGINEMDGTIPLLETALKECAKNATIDTWSKGDKCPHQRCRSMCNFIRNVPQWKAKYWSTWQKFGDEYHKDVPIGDPKEKEKILAKISTVGKALAAFKTDYKKLVGL
jgi:hypothetical protein